MKTWTPNITSMHLCFAFLLTGAFWMVVQLLEYVDWDRGGQKAILLIIVIISALAIPVLNRGHPLEDLPVSNFGKIRHAWWLFGLFAVVTLIMSYILSEPAVAPKAALGVIATTVCAAAAALLTGLRLESIERHLPTYVTAFCIGALLYRLASFLYYLNIPALSDIAQTTLAAIDAVLKGENPYAIPIDLNPAYPDYYGYKYLPVMIATYLPLGASLGTTGMRLTNLVLDMITAVFIGSLARSQSGRVCAILAASLYLMLPMVPRDLYMNAVTDLAPTLPLLAAMMLYATHPAIAGVMVGLSVSAKILPGLVFVVVCFPPLGRWGYLGGFLLGLIPAIIFFLLNPSDFLQNIVWFVAMRPIDSTSWLYTASPYVIGAARLVFLIVMVAVSFAVIWRPPDLLERCALAVVCSNMALLAGPATHNNYMLWWIPFFCVLLSSALSKILSTGASSSAWRR
jgi:hypothetical protein